MARRGDGIYQRGKTWWLDFRHDGRRHVARLGKSISRTVAGELASVQRAAILKGEAGIGGPKRKDLVFDKAADEFMRWAEANKRPLTAKTYRSCLERLREAFKTKRLGELSPFDLERYKRGRIEAGVLVMVNRELQCLRSLYNRCTEWGLYEGSNPAELVKPLRESPGRLRYLEPDEEARLLAATHEPMRSMMVVGIYGGLRLVSEALTLRWADIDLRRNLMTVQGAYAKSGKPRSIPLNTTLRATLARLRQEAPDSAEWVFAHRDGTRYRRIGPTFRAICIRIGLTDVSPHTLRHTFASRLAMAGVDVRTIQELGGWASLAMVQRYTHLSHTHKADAVERIASPNFPTLFTTAATAENVVRRKIAPTKAALATR